MPDERFDRNFGEQRWEQALREHPDAISSRPPNAHLVAETRHLTPGRALDAGCGHGSETIWLAASGWQVTAVDFSVTALDPSEWEIVVAEERVRAQAGTGVDAVIHAIRRHEVR